MNKTLQLLGLARRAGRLIAGTDAVTDAVKKGKAKAILLTADASVRHARELKTMGYEGKTLTLPCDMDTAGAAVGKRSCIFALTDGGFAAAVEKSLNEEDAKHASKI